MKKVFTIAGLLAVLTMSSCARKGACPAYGSVTKHTPATQAKA
ncbi:hypothetical protein [Rudanella paleaurantiibacter]|nr:hypothetical protein [Rudanella paleaurantiibacter]